MHRRVEANSERLRDKSSVLINNIAPWIWIRKLSPHNLLCSIELTPQMTDGARFPGDVTENVSVRHWPALAAGTPAPEVTMPLTVVATLSIAVEGPVMEKVVKSKRNWRIEDLRIRLVVQHKIRHLTEIQYICIGIRTDMHVKENITKKINWRLH